LTPWGGEPYQRAKNIRRTKKLQRSGGKKKEKAIRKKGNAKGAGTSKQKDKKKKANMKKNRFKQRWSGGKVGQRVNVPGLMHRFAGKKKGDLSGSGF